MKILICNNVPAFANTLKMDLLMASSFVELGHEVLFSTCFDGALDGCLNRKFGYSPRVSAGGDLRWKDSKSACKRCQSRLAECVGELEKLGVQLLEKREAVPVSVDVRESVVEFDGIDVEEHVFSSVCRYFASGRPQREPDYEAVTEQYRRGALTALRYAYADIISSSPDLVIAHHGIYVPQGLYVDVAKKLGVPVVTWNLGYRKNSMYFAHGDTYHKAFCKKNGDESSSYKSTITREECELYLSERETGRRDWVWYNALQKKSSSSAMNSLGVDANCRVVSVFTNVGWDAQANFDFSIFEDMYCWLEGTINGFDFSSSYLIIREHPGEILGTTKSRFRVSEFLQQIDLPSRCVFVPAESEISSYQLGVESDLVVVYASKIGPELAARGKPVVVANDCWGRGRGFTLDPLRKDDYFSMINDYSVPSTIDDQTRLKALDFCKTLWFEWTLDAGDISDYIGHKGFDEKLYRTAAQSFSESIFFGELCRQTGVTDEGR